MKILVVEDMPQHLKNAIETLTDLGVEVVLASNSCDAIRILEERMYGSVDGVITDIFMPFSNEEKYDNANEPCGVGVALVARELSVPAVFCTDGWHHDLRYQWISTIGVKLGLPMIDCVEGEAIKVKDWKEALRRLKEKIEPNRT